MSVIYRLIAYILLFVTSITIYCMVWYWAEVSVSPDQQSLSCGSDYNFDIILNTSGNKVISSDVKFFINGIKLNSIVNLWGFDQFNYVGTWVATKWPNQWKIYYYINLYQNSFSNFVSWWNILIARLNISPLSGFNNWSIVFYNLSSNDDDSNIAVWINQSQSNLPINYVDNLSTTIDGNYILINCTTGWLTTWSISQLWWGWSTILVKDDCPDWDMSISYYDGSCGWWAHWWPSLCDVDNSNYSSELKVAYIYSYMYGITTMCPVNEANLDGYLYRNHFAKMISEFAVNVLWKEPELWKSGCDDFDDINWDTQELKWFMKTACELWLMWLHSDWITPKKSFDPDVLVTRAQFGTVFSRLLFWDKYNIKDDGKLYQEEWYWYKEHLNALKENRIMTKIDWNWPSRLEKRWYVMLMMQRADNYGVFAWKIPILNGVRVLFD
jgi:hypothetical protein